MAQIFVLAAILLLSVFTVSVYSGECIDKFPLCLYWAKKGECNNNPKWMLKNCSAACDATCTNPQMAFVPCANQHKRCEMWKTGGKCQSNFEYMIWQCPKICGFCSKSTDAQPYPTEAIAYLAGVQKATATSTTLNITTPTVPTTIPTLAPTEAATTPATVTVAAVTTPALATAEVVTTPMLNTSAAPLETTAVANA